MATTTIFRKSAVRLCQNHRLCLGVFSRIVVPTLSRIQDPSTYGKGPDPQMLIVISGGLCKGFVHEIEYEADFAKLKNGYGAEPLKSFNHSPVCTSSPLIRFAHHGHNTALHADSRRPYSTVSEAEEEELDALYKWIDVEVKGHDQAVLNSYEKFVSMTAHELDVNIADILTPPRVIERRTLLKSIHIYKKHRVQYEARTHYRLIKIKHITGSTADTFLEYIQRNLPEGVAMKVTKCKLETFPKHIEEAILSAQNKMVTDGKTEEVKTETDS